MSAERREIAGEWRAPNGRLSYEIRLIDSSMSFPTAAKRPIGNPWMSPASAWDSWIPGQTSPRIAVRGLPGMTGMGSHQPDFVS